MKNALFILFLLVNLFVFSQTKQIAHKSHSGNNKDFVAENYTDNFGEPPQDIKTIKYLKNNCVIITYSYPGFYRPDSLCNHPYFTGKYTLEQIKAFYPITTEFIGFENQFFNDSIKKEKPKQKRNSFYLFALIGFIGGSLIVTLAKTPSRKLFTQKIAILILLLSSSSLIFSQTKQIAHKSHSGENQDFSAENYSDNFGGPQIYPMTFEPIATTKSVKLIKNNCVIVTKTYKILDSKTKKEKDVKLIDTLCGHPYFSGQYTFDEIKTFYLPNTKFIGFKNKFFNDSIQKKIEKPKQKRNSFYLFTLIGFIGGGLIVTLAKMRSRKIHIGILVFFLCNSFFNYSQTKQIAHKSHSGTNQDFVAENYSDNFGIVTPRIDSIILTKNGCIVEVPQWGRKDTVCDHPYFAGQYTLDEIKTFYPSKTKFIGFEGKFFNHVIQNPPPKKTNYIYIIALIGFIGGGSIYLFKDSRNKVLNREAATK